MVGIRLANHMAGAGQYPFAQRAALSQR